MDEMTKVYRGTRAEATADYGAEAPFLARDGWEPVATTFRIGKPFLIGMTIVILALPVAIWALGWLLGFLGWLIVGGIIAASMKGSGSLSVTFRRHTSSST